MKFSFGVIFVVLFLVSSVISTPCQDCKIGMSKLDYMHQGEDPKSIISTLMAVCASIQNEPRYFEFPAGMDTKMCHKVKDLVYRAAEYHFLCSIIGVCRPDDSSIYGNVAITNTIFAKYDFQQPACDAAECAAAAGGAAHECSCHDGVCTPDCMDWFIKTSRLCVPCIRP